MGSSHLLDDNYKKINHIASKCMRIFIVLIVVMWIYAFLSKDCNRVILTVSMAACLVISLIPTIVIDFCKIDKSGSTKVIVITLATVMCIIMTIAMSHFALLVWIFPLFISSLYYNKTLVLYSSLVSTIGIIISTIVNNRLMDLVVPPIYEDINDAIIFQAFPSIIIIFVMTFVAYFIVSRNSETLNELTENAAEMKANQKELIFAFAEISESKSKFTGEHIKRVADYMRILGEASGFDEEYVDNLATASMMHDIGKLMIPESILEKPGRLTEEEFKIMKNHVIYGDELLKNCPGELMQMARTIAKEHHEKWDGTGYLGMKGEEIAYISRLMAVCDVFDALSAERIYKKGWSFEETYDEIVSLSGKSFDPKVIKLFKENFSKFKQVLDENH